MKDISILIVDDSRPVGLRLQRYFGTVPWITTIQYAESLQLAGLLVGEQEFDVVILDHHFPDGDGSDFLVANGDRLGDVPVIVYSAFGSSMNYTVYRELGVDAVIDKSAAPEDLLATIEALTVGAETDTGRRKGEQA